MTWSADDERWGRKVGYWSTYERDGETREYETTAYLHAEVEPDVYTGTNKHSDEPVTVRWNDQRERYEEIA
jgi:hypothetical protein